MTSRPNAQPGPTPKYIHDFSKALAGEVKILLAEVGKLRDEKRSLEYEVAELMSIKARHSASLADGGYAFYPGHGWRPQIEGPPPQSSGTAASARAGGGDRPGAQPGQHGQQIVLRGSRAPPPVAPAHLPVERSDEAETRRVESACVGKLETNPLLAPGASAGPNMPFMSPPPRDGLFGPKTPPPKAR
ncbi:hypothetical protein B0H13DRAFT_2313201 [Mycena leptocephala]|nr:hypothetical protein B0H13DRAFT_2313201 [Mycena leptocephala]